ncbi:WD repeat-containing protein WRAP73 [Galemys pyrenaicus]|uniref:WD repeat-containing protein WRAP73 n=1 Tax=Galemys pyrenaicus TaxID=202257 RepID=A0A8J6DEI2_GALPY|nr:WD repeat-containing protein WRAP73 [Galemys pyrenaicus]
MAGARGHGGRFGRESLAAEAAGGGRAGGGIRWPEPAPFPLPRARPGLSAHSHPGCVLWPPGSKSRSALALSSAPPPIPTPGQILLHVRHMGPASELRSRPRFLPPATGHRGPAPAADSQGFRSSEPPAPGASPGDPRTLRGSARAGSQAANYKAHKAARPPGALIGGRALPPPSLPASRRRLRRLGGRWVLSARPARPGAAAMNFSEPFKLSGLLCKFSPDGKYLGGRSRAGGDSSRVALLASLSGLTGRVSPRGLRAHALGTAGPESVDSALPPTQASCVQYRLVVRDAHSLQVLQLFACLDQIQHLEWSADSLFILCAMYRRGLVQVWSLERPEWHCKIDEGSAGLVASCWSPDGRHILNTTDFHVSGRRAAGRARVASPCPAREGVCTGFFPGRPADVALLSQQLRGCPASGPDLTAPPPAAAHHRVVTVYEVRVLHQVPQVLPAGAPAPCPRQAAPEAVLSVLVLPPAPPPARPSPLRPTAPGAHGQTPGLAFTRDGRYLALAERRDCRDYVSIFVCSDWQLLRHFDTDTQDLAGIEWAPNGCVLAVWDSCLEYKILLYSLDGRLLSAYSAYEWSLGIKAVAWSPSSQFLAVGSYDGKVRVLNHVTWKMLAELGHPAAVTSPRVVVYQEAEKSSRLALGRTPLPPPRAAVESKCEQRGLPAGRADVGSKVQTPRPLCSGRAFEVASVPVSLQTLKPMPDRANPKIGIGALAFSPDNCFLATRNGQCHRHVHRLGSGRPGLRGLEGDPQLMRQAEGTISPGSRLWELRPRRFSPDHIPNAVWIWDVRKLRLSVVLEHRAPVRAFQWDPRRPRLAICTAGSKVYLWSPAGCLSVQVPGEGDFQVLALCWRCRGDLLALLGRDHFCLCFLEAEEGVAPGQLGDHT